MSAPVVTRGLLGDHVRTWWDWPGFLDYCQESADRQAGYGLTAALAEARRGDDGANLAKVEAEVADILAEVELEIPRPDFERVWDVAGSEVDIDRYLAGEPECLIEYPPLHVAKAGRSIRLIVSTALSGGVSAEVVRARGAAIIALCDALAARQHPLEVWITDSSTKVGQTLGAGQRLVYSVLVQSPQDPYDRAKVLYAVSNADVQRQLCFACYDAITPEENALYQVNAAGRGAPGRARTDDVPDAHGEPILLDTIQPEQWKAGSAAEWVKGQLRALFD